MLYPIPVPDSNNATEFTRLRNGVNRGTQTHNRPGDNEAYGGFMTRRQNSVRNDRGLHETMEYYDDCTKRDRNVSKSPSRNVCASLCVWWLESCVCRDVGIQSAANMGHSIPMWCEGPWHL